MNDGKSQINSVVVAQRSNVRLFPGCVLQRHHSLAFPAEGFPGWTRHRLRTAARRRFSPLDRTRIRHLGGSTSGPSLAVHQVKSQGLADSELRLSLDCGS